jgi:hypothetical protein
MRDQPLLVYPNLSVLAKPRVDPFVTNLNRRSILSLAARRKGIARYAALHLDYARSASPAGRYRFTVGTVVLLPLNRKAQIDIRSGVSFRFR